MKQLYRRKLAVVVGRGGVGKTTIATTLSIAGANSGLKTALITVDPAARLVDLLQLKQGGVAEKITLQSGYSFDALFADRKSGMDQFVTTYFNRSDGETLLNNPVYKTLTTLIGGAQELSAIYLLWDLIQQNYDLIVVDTPPRDQAWDFLTTPKKIGAFLDTPVVRLLLRYHHLLKRKKKLSGERTWLLRGLKRFIGVEALGEISAFLTLFIPVLKLLGVYAGEMEQLLNSDQAGYAVISDLRVQPATQIEQIIHRLKEEGKHLDLICFNRSLYHFLPEIDSEYQKSHPEHHRLYNIYHKRALREAEWLKNASGACEHLLIPRLPEEPITLPQLEMLAGLISQKEI